MAQKKMTFITLYFLLISCLAAPNTHNKPIILTMENLQLNSNIKKSLLSEIYSHGDVSSVKPRKQRLLLNVAGLHPKKCSIALSKISQFENYKSYSDIVKDSQYSDKTSIIKLHIDHLLMPFPMFLRFKIKRTDSIGNYPFVFQGGFLKGLKGSIRIGEHKKRCLFFVQAFWYGPKTRIPDKIFSFFTTVLGEKLLEKLFHVSRTL